MNKPRTILVTGGAGFIGSHLVEALILRGDRVISLDNYFTGRKENHIDGAIYLEGHTKDIAAVVPQVPDIIYHLGEYARVEQSVLEPDIVHDLNVLGTQAVLTYWREKKCKLVYAGSSTKFGDGGRTRCETPYAITKARNSDLVKEMGEKQHLPYAITYFYNVYGPRERSGTYGTVIETFKQMYLSGQPITVVAPGSQKRNFTHVDDIVNGLIRVGESGEGDEFGLGNKESFSILEVAQMFGGPIVMLPARVGNRMETELDTSKSQALGWVARHVLAKYIETFVHSCKRGTMRDKRILVFSTTFFPSMGPAEESLMELMQQVPDVQFDIVTTRFSSDAEHTHVPLKNVHIYRVGWGTTIDKYFLPLLGLVKSLRLVKEYDYLFTWSLMASYAAMAALLLKNIKGLPLLITLADQKLDDLSFMVRFFLKQILSTGDQVYGTNPQQERRASEIISRGLSRHSLGEGDAFANQLRFSYSEILMKKRKLT